jgi:hypothetical protein
VAGDVNASVADLKSKVRLCPQSKLTGLRWRLLRMQ